MGAIRLCFLLVLPVWFAGCGAIFNPYKSSFQCPETYNGKCVSVETAYDESVHPRPLSVADEPGKNTTEKDCRDCSKDKENGPEVNEEKGSVENRYERALYKELTGLIEEPRTPIVAPPRVVRVLLLPYKGEDNQLYMLRYIYFFADEHKWILGDYLNRSTR